MTKLEKKILQIPFVAAMIRRSKRVSLPGMQGLPVYDVFHFFMQQVKKIGFSERAASISFNIIMAIPGGLIFMFTLVPFLPKSVDFHAQMIATLDELIKNEEVHNLVTGVVEDFFNRPRSGLLWFSIIFIIFFSSNAVMGIMHTFDRSYFEERSSRFMAKRWTAFKITAWLIFMVVVSILLLAMQGSVKIFILQKLGWDNAFTRSVIDYSRWIVIFALFYFTIASIYHYGPAVKERWGFVSPGTVIATLLMIGFTGLFSMWINNFGNYNKIYGSIASVIIIMNLVYVNALILLIGFEINVSITAIKAKSERRQAMEDAQADASIPLI